MRTVVFSLLLCGILLYIGCSKIQNEKEITDTILSMEKAAMNRWGRGDPSGFLEISDPGVVYFDPLQEKRLDGLESLTKLYKSIRGKVHIDRYELLNPKVQLCGNAAVLTFNYVSWSGDKIDRWNCTEVYKRTGKDWRIIQTHWSLTSPFK